MACAQLTEHGGALDGLLDPPRGGPQPPAGAHQQGDPADAGDLLEDHRDEHLREEAREAGDDEVTPVEDLLGLHQLSTTGQSRSPAILRRPRSGNTAHGSCTEASRTWSATEAP